MTTINRILLLALRWQLAFGGSSRSALAKDATAILIAFLEVQEQLIREDMTRHAWWAAISERDAREAEAEPDQEQVLTSSTPRHGAM